MKTNFEKFASNVKVIPNGYDTVTSTQEVELDTKFTMVHIGLMNADRNHTMLWEVLRELCLENADFNEDLQLKFVGSLATEVKDAINKNQLNEQSDFIEYVPHHEASKYQRSAQVLLLPINRVPSAKGIITGKIFEYLQAKRPILAIAPFDGDLAEIINKTATGIVVDFDDAKTLKKSIQKMYLDFKNKNLNIVSKNVEQYHRKRLTEALAGVINELVE